ncbi:putative bleomycin hydrolase [Medicago truncatula]|uniref:Acyl-peptide hydrolase-like protein n=1 Tax=Medicago truncatula TaxID=3880 RepID=G7IXL5_MEDTR|nr:probable dipeptidyl-peptidase 5 [Medicago truncatula]AES70316.1 acyl-peptide hydrolase-like protein [Medicago truncatula]RHN67074.1 putative bleomycin hydrolase [Medicago truncatula]
MATLASSALTLITLTRSSSSSSHYSKCLFNHFSSKTHHQRSRFCSFNTSTTKTMASYTPPSESDTITTAPYGSWKSPITADVVSGASKRLGGTAVDGRGRLIWLESRPTESGRAVLVLEPENPGGEAVDITPKEFGVRTLAQEYGGGAFTVAGDVVFFANYKDQRLYKQSITSLDVPPIPLTPDYGGPVVSYADGVLDTRFNRFIAVREDRRESSQNPPTTIVSIALGSKDDHEPEVLVGGSDFYAFPRLGPKSEKIAWIQWSHPNMPWDKSELWVGYISENGEIYKRVCVAGNDPSVVESPTEPKWSSDGELFFITDRGSGFWNLHKWIESENKAVPVYSLDAEFARPLWVFGMNSYEFVKSPKQRNLIACSYRQKGVSYLGIIEDAQGSNLSVLDIPFTDIDNITSGTDCLFVEGASAVLPSSVAKVALDDKKSKVVDFNIIWSSSPDSLKYSSYISKPELIEFPTEVPGQNAYAYFYPPSNPTYRAIEGEKPPLLLKSHGGPTAETHGILNLSIQYWTSRGWAFADVNYGGSTGYGREYRDRLLGRWGIVDVNDCCSCATYLVDSGKVDGERLCITGGSAGGYTTLAALAFKDTFKAGASLYGVADLKLLVEETHKFESHYIDNLVGGEKAWFERSPINHVDKFSCPIILFQGLEDKVVPPSQAREIYQALKKKGVPVALIEYEGEQHGFRKAENIKYTLEQQMLFFARLIGRFNVADDITPVKIENFD